MLKLNRAVNPTIGVKVYDRGTATVERCDLRDNVEGAWLIEPNLNVIRRANLE